MSVAPEGPDYRQAWNYGSFQYTQVRNQRRLRLDQSKIPMPAALNTLSELAPIYLLRFDNSDVIRAVVQPSDGYAASALTR
jgi:hypothetical protein